MNKLVHLLLSLALLMAAGCVTPSAGSDPVVVQAEALAENAAESLDAFVKWEYRNRSGVGKDVTAAADLVREYAPGYITNLRTATKQYKSFRSGGNLIELNQAIDTLQGLLETVRAYYQTKVEP